MTANDNARTANASEDDDGGNGGGLPSTASPFPLPAFRRREPVGWLASALAFAVAVCALIFAVTALFGPRWWG